MVWLSATQSVGHMEGQTHPGHTLLPVRMVDLPRQINRSKWRMFRQQQPSQRSKFLLGLPMVLIVKFAYVPSKILAKKSSGSMANQSSDRTRESRQIRHHSTWTILCCFQENRPGRVTCSSSAEEESPPKHRLQRAKFHRNRRPSLSGKRCTAAVCCLLLYITMQHRRSVNDFIRI